MLLSSKGNSTNFLEITEIDRKSVAVLTIKSSLELLGTSNLSFTHKAVGDRASHLPQLVVPIPQGEQAVPDP